ncbi:hypothetical protein [Streptomyces sp. NBC_00234]|uniref:hypothetical protein n=1 Tax=Streptomyces sp. NBC_00234 TaxID=2903638 RepID=UPI002E2E2DAB|nr:hypothetical protein [Streptomyces sp. NBC_00234]
MIFGRRRFVDTVENFEAAVRAQDADAAERAFAQLTRGFGKASDTEVRAAAPRLAALLGEVPPGPRAVVAVMTGACVERGADPLACAPDVFASALDAFENAAVFCERWAAADRGELPDPEGSGLEEADFERIGFEPVMGWQALPQFEMACVAMPTPRGSDARFLTARG